MKKLMLVAFIAIAGISLTACGSQSSSKGSNKASQSQTSTKPSADELVQKGLDQVTTEHYAKAESYLAQAVDATKQNTKAKTYLSQLKLFEKARGFYQAKKYTQAKTAIDQAAGLKNKSAVIATKVDPLQIKINAAIDSSDSSSKKVAAAPSSSLSSESSSSSNTDQSSSSSSSSSKVSQHDQAEQIRSILKANQGFSVNALESVSDAEIIQAAKPSLMSNSDIARTAGTLIKAHPDLKQDMQK